METSLIKIVEENGLEKAKSKTILDQFTGFFEQAKEWEIKAKTIVITDVLQRKEMKEAREARLALKDIRVNADKVRKELKEQSLREGKAIDGIANVIKALVVPIEEYLEKQEKFVEFKESERLEKLNSERISKLSQFIPDTSIYNVMGMTDEAFAKLLETSEIAHNAIKEAEIKAEKERLEKEEADRQERARMKSENEKLKQEAEAREKALAKERAEQEKRLQVEKAKAKAEAEAREKAENELRIKKEAEEKAVKELKEKQEVEKLQKDRLAKEERYKTFLKDNEYNEKTKHLFHIEKVGNEVRLYKIINTFNIE